MANFHYYLKSSKNDKMTNINLRITANSQQVVLYTGIKVKPSCWCNDKSNPYYQHALNTKGFNQAAEINIQLDKLKKLALKAVNSIDKENPSPAEIKNRLLILWRGKEITTDKKKEVGFFDFWEVHLSEKKRKINPRTNKLISSQTIKCLAQTRNVLLDFQRSTRYKLTFSTLDLDFYYEFSNYCEKIKKYRSNTFGKHIGNIKEFMGRAEKQGFEVSNDYKSVDFRSPRELTSSIYLNEDEIKKLIELDLSDKPHLERTRDFFAIGCYTGLRWSDFSNLNKANFRSDKTFVIKMTKTKIVATIPILSKIEPVFNKYFIEGRYQFPKPISNQKFNEQIKEVASEIVELKEIVEYVSTINGKEIVEYYPKWEMVSSHTARRSFATNMYLRKIDPFRIMKITGHKSIRQFYEYIKESDFDSAISLRDQFNETE